MNTDVTTATTPAFQGAFINSTAKAINVDASRVSITGISSGSCIITVAVAPDPAAAANPTTSVSPAAAIANLIVQAASPTSTFVQALSTNLAAVNISATNMVDTNYTAVVQSTVLCPNGQYLYTCPDPAAPAPAPSSSGLSTTDTIVTAVLCSVAGAGLLAALIWYFTCRTPDAAPAKSAGPEFSTVMEMEGKPQAGNAV